jgi:hypothetical protein
MSTYANFSPRQNNFYFLVATTERFLVRLSCFKNLFYCLRLIKLPWCNKNNSGYFSCNTAAFKLARLFNFLQNLLSFVQCRSFYIESHYYFIKQLEIFKYCSIFRSKICSLVPFWHWICSINHGINTVIWQIRI